MSRDGDGCRGLPLELTAGVYVLTEKLTPMTSTSSLTAAAAIPAASSPETHNATCTAQSSSRSSSLNSRVPSTGSRIQTRSAVRRAGLLREQSGELMVIGRAAHAEPVGGRTSATTCAALVPRNLPALR